MDWKRNILMATVCMLCGYVGLGRTLYVSPAGTNDASGYYPDWAGAATTISAAVARATSSDTIYVTNNAVYTVTTNIVLNDGITMLSYDNNGAMDPTNTIVDGNGQCACFYINATNALVAGFTITNGNGLGGTSADNGGGVELNNGGILSNCIVVGNVANLRGGGVSMNSGTANKLLNCRVIGNRVTNLTTSVYGGGGVYVSQNSIVRDCTISGNSVLGSDPTWQYNGGGGVYMNPPSQLTGCDVRSNAARNAGGGVFMTGVAGGTILVESNTITGNRVVTNYGLGSGGGIYIYEMATNGIVRASTIASNRAYRAGGIMVLLANSAGRGCFIEDCFIHDNLAESGDGGGIIAYGFQVNYVTISNCAIFNNQATNSASGNAGGVLLDSAGLLVRCAITNNLARGNGGGVRLTRTNIDPNLLPTVRNCLVRGNTAQAAGSSGAGIYMNGTGIVESCTVVDNVATGAAGGIVITQGACVSNTICWSNRAANNTNVYFFSAVHSFSYNSTTPTNGATGVGNMDAYPVFVNPGNANYRLSASSPCVNAGMNQAWMDNATDLDGKPRLDRITRRVDMGAYEYIFSGTMVTFR